VLILFYPFLRKFGFLKMFIVSICVTYITVFIPTFDIAIDEKSIYLWQRFLVIVCLLIPFEIIDVKNDEKSLNTLPQIIGVPLTKCFGFVLLFICSFFLNLDFKIAFIILLFIMFSNANRSKYYTIFWVESLPIFWLLYYLHKF
jgi:hypothetical protein